MSETKYPVMQQHIQDEQVGSRKVCLFNSIIMSEVPPAQLTEKLKHPVHPKMPTTTFLQTAGSTLTRHHLVWAL
jgi:hypothetical protein